MNIVLPRRIIIGNVWEPMNQEYSKKLWDMLTSDAIITNARILRDAAMFKEPYTCSPAIHESLTELFETFLKMALRYIDAFGMVPYLFNRNDLGYMYPIVPDFKTGNFEWRISDHCIVEVRWAYTEFFPQRIAPVYIAEPPTMSSIMGFSSKLRSLYTDNIVHTAQLRGSMDAAILGSNPVSYIHTTADAGAHGRHSGAGGRRGVDQGVSGFGNANRLAEMNANRHAEENDAVTSEDFYMIETTRAMGRELLRWNSERADPNTGNVPREYMPPPRQIDVAPMWDVRAPHAPITPDMKASNWVYENSVFMSFGVPLAHTSGNTTKEGQTNIVSTVGQVIIETQKHLTNLVKKFSSENKEAFTTNTPDVSSASNILKWQKQIYKRDEESPENRVLKIRKLAQDTIDMNDISANPVPLNRTILEFEIAQHYAMIPPEKNTIYVLKWKPTEDPQKEKDDSGGGGNKKSS
jgi:hypothetical protein